MESCEFLVTFILEADLSEMILLCYRVPGCCNWDTLWPSDHATYCEDPNQTLTQGRDVPYVSR